jgi:hypothetical protein
MVSVNDDREGSAVLTGLMGDGGSLFPGKWFLV